MSQKANPISLNPNEKSRYVSEMFSHIARRYDLMNTLMTAGQDRGWRDLAIRLVRPEKSSGNLGLDIAAGTGELALALAREGGLDGVIASDFCLEMLLVAAAKVSNTSIVSRSKRAAPITLIVGDGLRLPFPDDTFACTTVGFGVRNFVDLPQAFSEMRRVLKPGGRAACLELTRSPNGLFNIAFDLYFDHIVPLIGKLVAGNTEAYTYLPNSVKRFPPAEELASIMRSAGLHDVHYRRLGLGTVALHIGTK